MEALCVNNKTTLSHDDMGESMLPIYGVTPFTMLDFPGQTSCIIWFSGCNMRCGYCHNPQIVKGKGRGSIDDVIAFLEKRRGLLDGVVLSGGEATLYPDLLNLVKVIKDMGYFIKLDTNGTRPEVIKKLLDDNLIDYIALDYKAPPRKFKKVTGISKFIAFEETLKMLCDNKTLSFEVRTTVHVDLMDENDISEIIADLDHKGYSGAYYIQNYIFDNGRPTLGGLVEQSRKLNRENIVYPSHFDIEYRNF